MVKKLFLILIIFCSTKVYSQKFHYIIDFKFNVDNLEGSYPYQDTRTLMDLKLAPQIGFKFGENHMLMGGADFLQTIGESKIPTKADYTLYYRYSDKNFGITAGAFPNTYRIGSYPTSFFRNDYIFENTNLDGAMFQFTNNQKTGYFECFFDWYEMNKKDRIDGFMIAASSEYSFFDRKLFLGGSWLLNHYKNEDFIKDGFLLERMQYNIFVGTDFKSLIPALNELSLKVGTLSMSERKRKYDTPHDWTHALGWQASLSARYKGFGLSNDFYFGEPQFKYYQQYGLDYYPGSPFYQAKQYNRTNLFYKWNNKFLEIRADLILHVFDGQVANQQIVTLRVHL